LQSSALPLGHGAWFPGKPGMLDGEAPAGAAKSLPVEGERETGLEPATPTLARWCSTN
jgi:hypothetical protein